MDEKSAIYALLLNLPAVEIDDVVVEARSITISCHIQAPAHPCPNCGATSGQVNQRYTRRLRDLNRGVRHVYLELSVRQFYCPKCTRYYSETPDFADLNKAHTHRQADYMFCLARQQSDTAVAAIVDVSPKTVERVTLSRCEALIAVADRYAHVRRLGIDEQPIGRAKRITSAS